MRRLRAAAKAPPETPISWVPHACCAAGAGAHGEVERAADADMGRSELVLRDLRRFVDEFVRKPVGGEAGELYRGEAPRGRGSALLNAGASILTGGRSVLAWKVGNVEVARRSHHGGGPGASAGGVREAARYGAAPVIDVAAASLATVQCALENI